LRGGVRRAIKIALVQSFCRTRTVLLRCEANEPKGLAGLAPPATAAMLAALVLMGYGVVAGQAAETLSGSGLLKVMRFAGSRGMVQIPRFYD
jgi:hypothetical protein